MSGNAWSYWRHVAYGFLRLVGPETRVFCYTGLTFPVDPSPRIERLKKPMTTARKWSLGMARTLYQKRSSCLWFQLGGVETYLLLPDDQSDRSNLPRQGETRHRWSSSFGKQGLVKITQGTSRGAGPHGRTFENIFEVVVMVFIQATQRHRFLGSLELPLHDFVLRTVMRSNPRPL